MRRKIFIVSAYCGAGLLVVLIVLVLLAPLFVGQKTLRHIIAREISQAIDADAQVSQVSLSVLPRPRVVLSGMTLALPDGVSLTIKSADVYLALLPLLAADIRPAHISLEAPDVNIPLQKSETSDPDRIGTLTLAGLHKQVTSVVAPVVEKLPAGSFRVEGGAVRIESAGDVIFQLSGVHAQMDVSSNLVSVDLTADSNCWKKQSLRISLRPDDLSMEGVASVSGLDPRPLAEYFLTDTITLGKTAIDATCTFSMDKTGALRTGLESSISYLTLVEGEKEQVIQGSLRNVLLEADARHTSVSFSAQFDYPKLNASGTYAFDNNSREIVLDVDAKNIDLLSCEDVMLFFFEKEPLIRNIADRLEGGIITDISFDARGLPDTDLIENKNFALKGRFSKGRIIIPEAGLDIREASGEVGAQGGLLEATHLQARCDESMVYDGTVKLNLLNDFKPLQVESMFSFDLAQLSRLAPLIPDQELREELSLIKTPRGTVSGKLSIREEEGSYTTEVDLSTLDLKAGYRSFPSLLTLSAGTCIYGNDSLTLRGLAGKLGRSALQNISARFDFNGNRLFEVRTRDSAIMVDELLQVLNSFSETQEFMRDITRGTGTVGIKTLDITGPLGNPKAWKFNTQGTVNNVLLTAGIVEGPVAVSQGVFSADHKTFSLRDAGISLLDSTLNSSVTLEGYLQGIERATVDVRGSLGLKSLGKAAAYLDFPDDLMPRAPLSIARSQAIWVRNGATHLTGDFSSAGGAQASLELRTDPEALEIEKLTISDTSSDCTVRLGVMEDCLDITYKGMLRKETLDRLLVNNRLLQGWMKGDFTAHVEEHNPLKSTAAGTLAWQDVQYGLENLPLNLKRASVSATGNTFLVDNAEVTIGTSDITVQGTITCAEEGYVLDLDLASARLDLDDALTAIFNDNDTGDSDEDEFWEIPLRGRAAFTAQSLSLAPFTWRPFHADMAFRDNKITFSTGTDTMLCEVGTPGSLVLTPEQISLAAHPTAQKASVKQVINCLTGEEAAILTGTLSMTSDLAAEGPASDLLSNLKGSLSVSARKGRIYRSNLLTDILYFLSVRNLLSIWKMDIARKGFAYNSLDIKAEVKGNTLFVREGILDSNTLTIAWQGSVNLDTNEIAFTMLATPLQVYDRLLMSIPVVGVVFGNTLVGMPIKVTGTIADHKLGIASPLEIGKGLQGIAKNILKLPVKIIQPVLPQGKEENVN